MRICILHREIPHAMPNQAHAVHNTTGSEYASLGSYLLLMGPPLPEMTTDTGRDDGPISPEATTPMKPTAIFRHRVCLPPWTGHLKVSALVSAGLLESLVNFLGSWASHKNLHDGSLYVRRWARFPKCASVAPFDSSVQPDRSLTLSLVSFTPL